MQRFDLGHPGEGELVIGPVALGDDGHLVFAGTLERPVVIGGYFLADRERIGPGIVYAFEEGHAVSTLVLLNLFIRTRRLNAPHRCTTTRANRRGAPTPSARS